MESAWRNASFAAYAEHLVSDAFAEGLAELLTIGGGLRTVILCSEILWWRCHRRIIADVLVFLGFDVVHLQGPGPGDPHRLTLPARIGDGALTYAPA